MLTRLTVDSGVRSVLEEKIPKKLIQTREGAGKQKLSYVSGNFVIDQLNRAFNYAWSWSVDECWIVPSVPKRWKNNDTGKETVKEQPPVAHVRGTLTAMLKDDNGVYINISKSATGSKTIIGGATEQESIFKSAGTDALKKAASLFGIGAQLYRDDKEQSYFESRIGESYWDDEMKSYYRTEWSYIDELTSKGYDVDDIVATWSDSTFKSVRSLTPDALVEFVTYAREQEAASSK